MSDLYATERDKYRRFRDVWLPDYDSGLDWTVVSDAMASGIEAGDSLLDVGSGAGNIARWFREKGLTVTEVDIFPVKPTTIEAAAWDMDGIAVHDWVFCGDMMEHIPTDYVDQTLGEIRRLAGKGIYLSICCRPDNRGAEIGETLHLTVRPPSWWVKKVRDWPDLSVKLYGDNVIICSRLCS